MKPFFLGLIAAIVIAVGAHFVVDRLNWSAAAKYSSDAVRL